MQEKQIIHKKNRFYLADVFAVVRIKLAKTADMVLPKAIIKRIFISTLI